MQDDRHLGSHYYLCYASCLNAIAMLRYLPLVSQASQIAMMASNLFTLPSKPLFDYALLGPSYSVASCRCSVGCSVLGHGYHGISKYILFSLSHNLCYKVACCIDHV